MDETMKKEFALKWNKFNDEHPVVVHHADERIKDAIKTKTLFYEGEMDLSKLSDREIFLIGSEALSRVAFDSTLSSNEEYISNFNELFANLLASEILKKTFFKNML